MRILISNSWVRFLQKTKFFDFVHFLSLFQFLRVMNVVKTFEEILVIFFCFFLFQEKVLKCSNNYRFIYILMHLWMHLGIYALFEFSKNALLKFT